jgi:hypothetical protein
MIRRRALRVVTAAGFVAAALVMAAPSDGSTLTSSVARVGWWSQQPGAQPQPEGGFQVATGPSGDLSVAAVDVSISEGSDVAATLTMEGSETSLGSTHPAVLQVCVAATPWKDANPGAWADAPQPDCSPAAKVTGDGSKWTADVSQLVHAGGTTSLMVLPVDQPVNGVVDPGWQVTITKATVAATGTTASDSSTIDSSATSGSSSGSSSFGTGSSSDSFGTGTGSSAPAIVTPPAESTVTPAVPPATPPPAAAVPAKPPFTPTKILATPKQVDHNPWARLLLFLPLAALVGAGAALLRVRLGGSPAAA